MLSDDTHCASVKYRLPRVNCSVSVQLAAAVVPGTTTLAPTMATATAGVPSVEAPTTTSGRLAHMEASSPFYLTAADSI